MPLIYWYRFIVSFCWSFLSEEGDSVLNPEVLDILFLSTLV